MLAQMKHMVCFWFGVKTNRNAMQILVTGRCSGAPGGDPWVGGRYMHALEALAALMPGQVRMRPTTCHHDHPLASL